MKSYHDEQLRRYKKELEGMDTLEFALHGLVMIRAPYVVIVLVLLTLGYTYLFYDISKLPPPAVVLGGFVLLVSPLVVLEHLALRRIVKTELAKKKKPIT